MSQFNYAAYEEAAARAQSNEGRIGYFKLKDDGDEALVRINCSSVEELQFASVHTTQSVDGKWVKVSCLNPLGTYSGDACPLCAYAAANPNGKRVSKAANRVYLQLMCAYKDNSTGQFSAAIPVIWERPASFSREIANKIKDYGDLRNVVLKITRSGQAGDMKTTYQINYIPLYDKPELVPLDFSAFDGFNIAKHSYWEKTPEEINSFIAMGKFPGGQEQTNASPTATPVVNPYANYQVPNAPVGNVPNYPGQAPVAHTAPIGYTPAATRTPAGFPVSAPETAQTAAPVRTAPQAAPAGAMPAEHPQRNFNPQINTADPAQFSGFAF